MGIEPARFQEGFLLRGFLAAVLALTAFRGAEASAFEESLDAGDFLSPQPVVGSGIKSSRAASADPTWSTPLSSISPAGPW